MNSSETSWQWHTISSVENLFSWTARHSLCVAFYTAPWCFRCKQVEPKVARFPADFPNVQFLRVDVDALGDLGDQLDISVLPTFVLYLNAEEVHRLEGVPQKRPARSLAQAINTYLES